MDLDEELTFSAPTASARPFMSQATEDMPPSTALNYDLGDSSGFHPSDISYSNLNSRQSHAGNFRAYGSKISAIADTEAQDFVRSMKDTIVANYGHIVGHVVKEFFDTVMESVSELRRDKVKQSPMQRQLLSFFRTLSYSSVTCEAKLLVTNEIVEFVRGIRDKVRAFAFQNKKIWADYSMDPRYFKGLLPTTDEKWIKFIFEIFCLISDHLVSNTTQCEGYLHYLLWLLGLSKGGVRHMSASHIQFTRVDLLK